ncbi:hypothetical protein [Actinoplanes subglobosus]|uniref:Uncharacterized protein n=1 Tax=Actinoplanes subglobosus TaxID=1547892 RepID=A0ABV8J9C0_9ACTN
MLYKSPEQKIRTRVVRRTAVTVRPPQSPRRRDTTVQMIQTGANVLLLGLAFLTYHDQQDLMRDQLKLNARALERTEQRHAAEVTYWEAATYPKIADPRERVTLTMVRNMSAKPVTDVVLLQEGGENSFAPQVYIRMIPPCTEMKVWVQRGHLYDAWQRVGRSMRFGDLGFWHTARMDFVVGGKRWEATDRSLTPRPARSYDTWTPPEIAAARMVRDAQVTVTPECGDGE